MEVNLRELKKKTADGEHAAVMTDVACEEGCEVVGNQVREEVGYRNIVYKI